MFIVILFILYDTTRAILIILECTLIIVFSFITERNPTPSPVNEPGSARPITWHRYDNKDLNYLLINKNTTVLNHYRQRNFALWTDYLPWIINHNTSNDSVHIYFKHDFIFHTYTFSK